MDLLNFEEVSRYLTRNGIYAMGFGEEIMELLNSEEMVKQKSG